MLRHAWQVFLEDLSHFAFFQKPDEEPKSESGIAMRQQLAHDEVHALHIPYLLVVAAESSQHVSESCMAFVALFKIRVLGESPVQIASYLNQVLIVWRVRKQTFEMLFAFLVMSFDAVFDFHLFVEICLLSFGYFQPLVDFQENYMLYKPGYSVLASEAELRVFGAFALKIFRIVCADLLWLEWSRQSLLN